MRFESALRHGLVAVVVALAFVLCVAAPSNDLRARVPFLVLLTPMSLLVSWWFSALAALGAAVLIERFSVESIAGAATAATIGHLFVLSGVATRLVPEFETVLTGWLVCGCVFAVFLVYVAFERSRSRKVNVPA